MHDASQLVDDLVGKLDVVIVVGAAAAGAVVRALPSHCIGLPRPTEQLPLATAEHVTPTSS